MKYYKIPNGYLACEKELDYEEVSFDKYQQAIEENAAKLETMMLEQKSAENSLADEYQTPEDTLI